MLQLPPRWVGGCVGGGGGGDVDVGGGGGGVVCVALVIVIVIVVVSHVFLRVRVAGPRRKKAGFHFMVDSRADGLNEHRVWTSVLREAA